MQKHFDQVMLPDQPPETQHALGVAFGQRTAGMTGVTRVVGVDPARESNDLYRWPVPYRMGIVEGLVFGRSGYRQLDSRWLPTIVDVISPIPPQAANPGLKGIAEKVRMSTYSPLLERLQEDVAALIKKMAASRENLPEALHAGWNELIEAHDTAGVVSDDPAED